ncbi:MAG TPA: SDR family oxidoreductase [Steroidobacteraceae bacterium]
MSLVGSKVVIVGGSSGIGLGAAFASLDQGANVVIVGRSQDKLDAAVKELGKSRNITAIRADVTREDETQKLFDAIGVFDHLIVTRGTPPLSTPIPQLNINEARQFVETMLISSFSLAKHAHATLRKGGSITFTSGISKDKPPVSGGAVVAAVAGAMSYVVRALALELAPTRVNVISPGWVKTPMWDELVGEAKLGIWEQLAAKLPAGRIATPQDIARAYVYLMESDLTTGTTLHIDGGHALI